MGNRFEAAKRYCCNEPSGRGIARIGSKRIYRILGLSGYARIDYRLTEDGHIFVLEVNANPQIAQNEYFAESAKYCGVKYGRLLQKILSLAMSYNAME